MSLNGLQRGRNNFRMRSVLQSIIGIREILVIFLVIGTAMSFAFASPYFLTIGNITDILRQASIIGLPAIGLTFVVTAGEWDLSQESIAAMGSIISFKLLQRFDLPVWMVVLLCCAMGVGMGTMNGFFVAKLRLNSVIVTLATLGIWRGFAYAFAKVDFTKLSSLIITDEIFSYIGNGYLFYIPIPVVIWIIIGAVTTILLKRHKIGRYTTAIGDNTAVAIQAGIKVENIKLFSFILSGLLSSFAGVVITAWQLGISSAPAQGNIVPIITATLIGGTNLTGGYGTVVGSMLGASFITILKNGMNIMEIGPYIQRIWEASLLIVALYVASLQYKLRQKRQTI